MTFSQYFDLNDLPNGMYMLRITSGTQTVMKKIVLAR